MQTFELRLGHKKIYGLVQPDDTVTVLVDCEVLGGMGMVKFPVSLEQAEQLFDPHRRVTVQTIAPDLRPDLREIFISGTTPMEFEQLRGIEPDLSLARYGGTYVMEND